MLFGLLILGVPLAFPLALLVFLFSFIPLIGAPIATAIAAVVALAAHGPLIAGGHRADRAGGQFEATCCNRW